ncbi:MAG TPA: PPOX class F420-dependent oxidoreductase [Acidimicrobiia bacterium]|jgi:PPOX class probable F420-dependent enzyme
MAFDHLTGERFLSIATFRRSGDRVATPVWFAHEGDGIVIGTFANSGKAKRLRHTDKVEIAPCNFRGLVRGPYVSGIAVLLDPSSAETAGKALNDKYGWQWDMFGRKLDIYISVTPAED